MTGDMVIFLISAVVAVFGAVMMISVRNPVVSVLYLILSLVAQAVCYVQLGALFVGAILVVVYAGAIMVLFLFVIMLLNLRGSEDLGQPSSKVGRFSKYTISILLIMEMIFIVKQMAFPEVVTGILGTQVETFGSVESVAKLLFTKYMYPFQLTGILLTVAVVGAVVIARREDNEENLPHNDDDAAITDESTAINPPTGGALK